MPTTTVSIQPSLFGEEEEVSASNTPFFAEKPDHIGPTVVDYIQSRQILTRATGFMDSYNFTLNPYSGCSFGCSYCYAAFFNYDKSREQTWGEWVTVKENAVNLMQKRRKGSLNGKRIYMSSVTDPYQPIESRLNLTRQLLEVLAENHEPKLVVQTRSPIVTRDIDLYRRIKENGGRVQVNMTITTDDEAVRKAFEPSCPSNAQRLKAISQMQSSGIDSCITLTPLLLVNDSQQFIDELISSDVRHFIIQPFHFRKGRFVAGTRDKALDLLTEKLRCGKEQIASEYKEIYQDILQRMKTELKRRDLPDLGEGKDGFKPPF
ncbi:MAG: radical SAM protein [Caldilineaceae bacterium]|nr:radical SAM protein [Caldilineaceae bacterium]